ncbi:MAG: CpsD/CapB family tyrosine-protein kinase [Candidatus Omnitrophica bacterium]|nr:CpsD/CapB family tyrosine-protein kinase [Candidatus Omnitrophota bacterium]
MGKLTDALKKAAAERLAHMEKIEQRTEVQYQFVARKKVESTIDPRIVAFHDPHSTVSEQYRILRTNLQGLATHKPLKVFALTSATHGEGKTITSLNLAISMAHDLDKKHILLVDADLRRGRLSKYLGITAETGLAEVLTNGSNPDDALLNIGVKDLTVLPAGKVPHNPAELLGSAKFKSLIALLRNKYDYVIFDTPPIIPVTDAGVLAAQTDGVVMVIQANRTQKSVVQHAETLLKQAQAKMLGYILTNVQYHVPDYIYRYL